MLAQRAGGTTVLSYIFRLAFDFERNHGYWPNMLYLNIEQYQQWQNEFNDPEDLKEISRRLKMEIVISVDALHPHVAWLPNHNQTIAR